MRHTLCAEPQCPHCIQTPVLLREAIISIQNQRISNNEARARIEALEKVVEAAKGFRNHGVAKNGTHANILFGALDAMDED